MFDVLIIGAGPAGLAAALYAGRANVKVGLIEKDAPGGKLLKIHNIANYPGISEIDGTSLALNMLDQVSHLPIENIYGNVISVSKENDIFKVKCEDNTYESKTVIIATGSQEKHLNVNGEEQLKNKGVSYCATCDGALYKNKDVAIVISKEHLFEAIYLSNLVRNLYVISNEIDSFEELTKYENVSLIQGKVSEILGENQVEGIIVKDNQETYLKVDAVFVSLGFNPASSFGDSNITNEYGYIKVNNLMETSIKGLFAAGDAIAKSLRQIVTAANDGAIAATSALKYLK